MAYAHTFQANPHWLRRNASSSLDHVPGTDGPPIIGTTLEEIRDPRAFTERMVARHGRVYRTRSFGGRSVQLIGAEANELGFFDRDKLFSSEQGWGPMLNLVFPRGLMLMDFEKHRAHRRTLSVAFKPEPMRRYADALNQGIRTGIVDWSNRQIKFYPAIKQLTLDLAATSFLGIPFGPEATKVNQAFVDMVQATIGLVRFPLPFTAMRKGVRARAYLVDYFGREVPKRRAGDGDDIFSQICRARHEDGSQLGDDEIVDHMNFLMMAAHDTTTSSITTMVSLLGRHPEWQDRLREEMLGLGLNGDTLPYDRVDELVLTDYAFKESLRLIPPVPAIPRRAVRDFSYGGYEFPAGTFIGLHPDYTHHMAEYWPEPAKFDPMRFAPDAVRARHKYAWVPFGGGAHMCLGLHFAYLQAKIFFYHLLTTHRIVPAGSGETRWQYFPIPKPRDGLPVRLERL
ncbi:cytochrome P450 [Sphingomonas cavernae]|uniref:Cytochrome P450 n=1 Tax=Sphingomonas cavernae TaxID=2320861 RepID=A0A418WJX8_9SPHN|nr:cytochrome P450 [Sphingomonas cavernae]RJF90341.1 cytochrome P450 [Sphingomonas cavernae]